MPHKVRGSPGGAGGRSPMPPLARSQQLSATRASQGGGRGGATKTKKNKKKTKTTTKNAGTKASRTGRPRLQQDPEVVHALVRRFQNDIRELLLARNAIQAQLDSADAEIAALRKSDPFADSHAVLSRHVVGNIKPNDLMPTSAGAGAAGAGGGRTRQLSVDEEIKMLKSFLEKNKFNQVSVESALRDLDRLLLELKKQVSKIPLEHRETGSDKRVVLQGLEQEIHEQQMRGDEKRMARELHQERLKAAARHVRDELDEVSEELFQAKLRFQAVRARLARDSNQRAALLRRRDELLLSLLGDGDKGSDGWELMVSHAFSRCRAYGSRAASGGSGDGGGGGGGGGGGSGRGRADAVTIPPSKVDEAIASLLPTALLREQEGRGAVGADAPPASGATGADRATAESGGGGGDDGGGELLGGLTREQFRERCLQLCSRDAVLAAVEAERRERQRQGAAPLAPPRRQGDTARDGDDSDGSGGGGALGGGGGALGGGGGAPVGGAGSDDGVDGGGGGGGEDDSRGVASGGDAGGSGSEPAQSDAESGEDE